MYAPSVVETTDRRSQQRESTPVRQVRRGDVRLRALPYPHRAMLAICSDLDNTADRHIYLEIMRFLNTTQTTTLGPGVGLEVGNSIYFDMPPDEFAYWNTDDAGREMVRALIQSGHIDCLHSYGDLATTRQHAAMALNELARHGCRLEVWIDHRVAPSNFGPDIMCGSGDVRNTPAYHADLTCDFGIQYVWRGRITSIIGQDVPRQLGGLFNWHEPVASGRTLVKEIVKGVLGNSGHVKYAMHGPNDVLRLAHLRDGRPVYEFLRANPFWGGVENADTAAGLAATLTPQLLARLLEREGVCVFYTHLGKAATPDEPFNANTRRAFEMLADLSRAGKLLVTTTRRLLGYRRVAREVRFKTSCDADGLRIDVGTKSRGSERIEEPTAFDFAGLTFYVPEPERTTININGRNVPTLRVNAADHTGRRSVSLPWPRLEFPNL